MSKKFYKLADKVVFLVNRLISKKLQKYRDEDLIHSINEYPFSFISQPQTGSNNIGIRTETSDFDVFKQIFISKEYQSVVDLFNKYNYTPSLMIDAGANVGYSSLYLSAFFPDINIIALEPFEGNYHQLALNTKGINAQAIKAALWSSDDDLKISHDFRDGKEWSKTVTQASKKENEILVKAVSLGSILRDHTISSIDFFKIDIEGAEEEVIFSESFQQNIDIIKVIAVEIHDEVCSRQRICDFFSQKGFKWFNSGELVIAHKLN